MPILAKGGAAAASPQQLGFAERVRAGRVVPVLSDALIFDLVLGGHAAFVAGYADHSGYTGTRRGDVVHLTKFYKHQQKLRDQDLKSDYLNFVKNHIYYAAEAAGASADTLAEAAAQVDDLSVSAFARLLGYPQFSAGRDDPLLVMANLPMRTVLTTSPYTFIEEAFRMAGKTPRTEVCRWNEGLDTIDSAIDDDYKPSAQEPLVYHLHGLDQYPDSLVLTEDDYLEFLVNVSRGKGNDRTDALHALVRRSLADDLILLGFSLSDWAFHVIYAGMIRLNSTRDERGVCILQLTDNQAERAYLQDYVEREARFDVFWGDVYTYARELLKIL
jgi:hypothetical protein